MTWDSPPSGVRIEEAPGGETSSRRLQPLFFPSSLVYDLHCSQTRGGGSNAWVHLPTADRLIGARLLVPGDVSRGKLELNR